MNMKPLKIGETHSCVIRLIQGGMGVGVSLSSLAGAMWQKKEAWEFYLSGSDWTTGSRIMMKNPVDGKSACHWRHSVQETREIARGRRRHRRQYYGGNDPFL